MVDLPNDKEKYPQSTPDMGHCEKNGSVVDYSEIERKLRLVIRQAKGVLKHAQDALDTFE